MVLPALKNCASILLPVSMLKPVSCFMVAPLSRAVTLGAGARRSKNGKAKDHRYDLASLPGKRTAIISLAEAGRPGVVLGAEPAIGAGQCGIAAANLKVIDADVAGDTGAERVLALDAA